MLTYSNNRQYNRIFHNTENKNKLIQHFKLVLDAVIHKINIRDDIISILNNSIELCYDYTIISERDRLQNMISNVSILISYFSAKLTLTRIKLKNSTNTELLESESILLSIIKLYKKTYNKLNMVGVL